MIKTVLKASGLIVLFLLAQSTWHDSMAIFGVIPDITLIIIIYIALNNNGPEGQVTGFIAGIFEDFISAAPLGFNTIIKTLIGFIFSLGAGNFIIDKVFLPLLLGAFGTLLKSFISLVLALLFPEYFQAYDYGTRIIWIEMTFNAVLSPILFFLFDLLKNITTSRRTRV